MPDYGDDRGFGMNVPQRTVRPTMRDVAGPRTNYNEGYGQDDVTMSDVPFDPRSTFNRDTPVQMGGSSGEFSDRLYSGRNPFIQPIQTGGRQGEFGGMGRLPIHTGFGGKGSRIMGYEDPAIDSGQFLTSRFGGDLDGAQSERGALLAGEGFGQGDRIRRLEAQGNKVKKILESKYGVGNPIVKQKLAQYFDKMRKLGTGIFKHGVTKGNPLLNIMELLPEGVIEQGFDELNELTDPGVQII